MIFISNHKSPKNILDYKHQLFLLSIILIDSTFFAFIILLVFIPFISGQYVISIILLVTSIFLVYLYKKLQNKIIPEKVRLWTQGFISLAYFSKKYKPHFEENAEKHADIIINCLNEGKHDEYILLAHSAGCYPLIFLLARLPTEHLKKIKIITMGHCIPVYINLKHFQENKTNIISSLKKTNTLWLDVYSPADPVSSRINTEKEFLYLGIDSKNSKFFNMYEDETYLKLKENPLAIHFQYIMSGDKPINTLNFYKILTSNNPINNYEI
ncbi:hypothetical protein [Allofrancisella inopinata]|nr:hypothetical protein [Allofrancisella inopinata]